MTDVNVEGFPLSPQQRHLWKLTAEQAGATPYWSRAVVRIRGPLDVPVLRSILENLPARFEILRTRFYASEEMATPLQVIAAAADGRVRVDWQDLSGTEADAQRRAVEELSAGIAAALAGDRTAPLHATLAALSPQEHVLAIGMPAMRCDRAGLDALLRDVAAQYTAALTASSVSDDVLQYADVAISLNEILESADAEAGRRFWEAQDFSDALTSRLPFEQSRETSPAFAPERVPVQIAEQDASALAAFAEARGLSLEIVALACWQVLLQRTLGTDKVVAGYLSNGRSYAELEPAIGLFARCLPLAGELSDETPFADAARRLADAVGAATTWGECFDARALGRDRAAATPFVRLVFERVDAGRRHVAQNVSFEIERTDARTDRFTAKLCVAIDGDRLREAWIEYDGSICAESDVRRLAAQLEQILASAAASPDGPIGQLRILPAGQEAEILGLSGRVSAADSAVDPVHRRFEAHAARTPNATAVVCEDASLTYAQLNARANQLAHHLRALGVGADVFVGLCLERSVDVAVGILGILKASGAYVPLDPHLPAARLAGMLDDSRAPVVVSHSRLAALLPPAVRTVLLDRDRAVIGQAAENDLVERASPESAAYVLFTSGSTGKPKGVVIEHRQLPRYVDAVAEALDLPARASFATVTTFAADLGNTAVYPALCSGGCLHIVTEERASDPSAFAEYFERHAIDVLKIVPSHLKALLSSSRPDRVLPRQRLVLGGEASSWDLVDEVHRLAPACVVYNHYGPTETTVGATVYRVAADGSRPTTATVPIGRPLAHARAHVIDRHQQLVPLWVAGELGIGGAGVARGYLAAPDLTQDKFVADPWAGGRMYRTGDRVRRLPDGALEFLGRTDTQIKIRGFRVEVGEVENALRKHPRVKDLAVLAHDDGTGTKLAAFLVYRDAFPPQPSELKTFLNEQGVPDYMVPSTFAALDALPLTSNGKLDRQRLLASLADLASIESAGAALTEWESLVAGIWRELLGVDELDPRDNFYDLGGDSLKAIQVVTSLEKRAQVHVSPRDLVFHTLKQFAALCESKHAHAQAAANS